MLLKSAQFYNAAHLSTIATGENKRAILPWKEYQSRLPTHEDLITQFNHPKCSGLAVICGQVSNNLEVVDVDLKYDISGTLWDELKVSLGELIKKIYIVQTKSGGYHLYYRCEVIEGNLKLANRPASPAELKDNPHVKQVVLIETRGEGGYVIAPPTEGYTKQSDFVIPVISIDERDYILSACRSFNQFIEEVRPANKETNTTAYAKTPWDDYNDKCDVVGLLERHGWAIVAQQGERTVLKRPGSTDSRSSGDYHKGLNLFKVFTTSSEFEPGKGYKPYAVFTILEHGGNYSAAAKQLIKDGYGEAAQSVDRRISGKVIRSLGAGHTKEKVVDILMSEDGKGRNEAEQLIEDIISNRGPVIQTFWTVEELKVGVKITIQRHKLIQFLFDNGFHLYFYDKKSNIYRLVHQHEGFVNEVTSEGIKKFIKNYIENLPAKFDSITPNELLEIIMKGSESYFGDNMIEFLNAKDIKFLNDTNDTAYYPFLNGIVKVDRHGAKLYTYGEIDKAVWQTQVIEFNIDVDLDFDSSLCEFYTFLFLVAGSNQDSTDYLLSLIGYMLHQYKDPARPFAVVLAEETEDEKKGGGTGKGILVKALSIMSNIERVDGKNFKLDKNFAFQRVGLDTKIIAIEDVRKNVDFEGFYSIITEGVTVEKKNKDELFIAYKDSPKILFTTNYTIPSTGDHAKRRQRVFEFSNTFNAKNTPLDYFGHKLLDEDQWDKDEWNRFFNLMFTSVNYYLACGVKNIEAGNKIQRKAIRLGFSEEYLEWWDGMVDDDLNRWHPFREMYNTFLISNDMDKKDYSAKRFKKAIEESCEKFGYTLKSQRNGIERVLGYTICSNGQVVDKVADTIEALF